MLRWCLGMVLLGSLLVAAPARAADEPLRVLLVGDSVTEGSQGDWTWRYRLWKQFQAAGVPVDLVGPYDDLWSVRTRTHGRHGYLDRTFDQDHAARWGMTLAAPEVSVGELVATYQPDVVVEMLGVNDLQFGERSPAEVLELLRGLVAAARTANPDVDVVLGALFQRWRVGVRGVNRGLPGLAAELDEPGSRVVASDLGATVTRGDTWDGSHPTATGELKIAAAVGAALDRIGVPVAFADPLPRVADGPPDPAHLVLRRVGPHAVGFSWRLPLGANEARMWQRDRTEGERWRRLPYVLSRHRWTARHLASGHRYAFRLQAAKGAAVAEGVFSEVVRARTLTPR